VFLPKSAQDAEIARDRRNCELRRVCKRLKTKDCVLTNVGETRRQSGVGERQGGCRGGGSSYHELW